MIAQAEPKWNPVTNWAAIAGTWKFLEPGPRYEPPAPTPAPGAQALGFDVVPIDEINRPGIIFQDVQRKIEDAQVVIAEITAPNQSVYYEVGYAHALNKPTILLAQRGKDLPFDIRSYRVIFYDDSIGGKPAVEKTLREHLQAILQEL